MAASKKPTKATKPANRKAPAKIALAKTVQAKTVQAKTAPVKTAPPKTAPVTAAAKTAPAKPAGKPAPKPAAKPAEKTAAKKSNPPRRSAGDGNGRAGFIDGLAKRLGEHRQEILHLYRHDLDVGLDAFRDGDDEIDRANFDSDRDLALSLSDSEREVLLQIEEALRRVAVGAYGSCTSCAKPIAVERLHAIPWARYCIDCQELEEKGLLG